MREPIDKPVPRPTIKIVRDKKTGTCKGYAFLEMKDKEGAERAVEALDGTSIGDRQLAVKINEEKISSFY